MQYGDQGRGTEIHGGAFTVQRLDFLTKFRRKKVFREVEKIENLTT